VFVLGLEVGLSLGLLKGIGNAGPSTSDVEALLPSIGEFVGEVLDMLLWDNQGSGEDEERNGPVCIPSCGGRSGPFNGADLGPSSPCVVSRV